MEFQLSSLRLLTHGSWDLSVFWLLCVSLAFHPIRLHHWKPPVALPVFPSGSQNLKAGLSTVHFPIHLADLIGMLSGCSWVQLKCKPSAMTLHRDLPIFFRVINTTLQKVGLLGLWLWSSAFYPHTNCLFYLGTGETVLTVIPFSKVPGSETREGDCFSRSIHR
jgi:hypothetical protein